MTTITAITVHALGADQARIERVATNLSNVQTPGFKREVWSERSSATGSFARLMEVDGAPETGTEPFAPSTAGVSAIVHDLRQAALRSTGRSLDFALAGPGYFEISTPQGPAYTRRGDFGVDAHGRLVTSQGDALVGTGGDISVTSDQFTIDAQGRVLEADRMVGQLRLVDIPDADLHALGGGLYTASGGVREIPSGSAQVRQGFLENANVDMAHEMVDLAATARHFEAMLRVTQGRDELLGTAIRKLGDA